MHKYTLDIILTLMTCNPVILALHLIYKATLYFVHLPSLALRVFPHLSSSTVNIILLVIVIGLALSYMQQLGVLPSVKVFYLLYVRFSCVYRFLRSFILKFV